jgi:transposase
MTHDYLRNGVTTLFAAFDVLEGTVLGRCMQRHRHQEFLRFLNTIEAAVPAGKVIHVILDNYGNHNHPKVLRWLARHARFIFHFTPTSGSWLARSKPFFSALTRRRVKRGVFHTRSSTCRLRSTAISTNTTIQTVHLDQDAGADSRLAEIL